MATGQPEINPPRLRTRAEVAMDLVRHIKNTHYFAIAFGGEEPWVMKPSPGPLCAVPAWRLAERPCLVLRSQGRTVHLRFRGPLAAPEPQAAFGD